MSHVKKSSFEAVFSDFKSNSSLDSLLALFFGFEQARPHEYVVSLPWIALQIVDMPMPNLEQDFCAAQEGSNELLAISLRQFAG
jgi:hypothetical protein